MINTIPNNPTTPFQSIAKLFVVTPTGIMICTALFVLMHQLIKAPNTRLLPVPTPTITDFVMQEPPINVNIKPPTRLPPEPEQIMKAPKLSKPVTNQPVTIKPSVPTISLTGLTGVEIATTINTQIMTSSGHSTGNSSQAMPVVRMEPRYPAIASRDGIEGWVKLSFSINETGGVENIKVLDSNPKRIFDRSAIKALSKWQYRPELNQGKAVRQENQTVQLDFNLNKD